MSSNSTRRFKCHEPLMKSRLFFSKGLLFALLALSVLSLTSACATHSETRAGLVDDVRSGSYKSGMKRLYRIHEEASQKDMVMDLMDKGMLLHLLGRYEKSNRALDAAKRKLDELFGVSISDELAAIAWNEASRSFKGEEFERVMINLIMAFNYLHLGKLEDAGVEARQINHRLQVYVDNLERNKVKTAYKQDPFAQFLAGLIQEASDDLNDAFRSYEDALEGYGRLKSTMGVNAPNILKASVLRAARKLHYGEAIEKYEKRFQGFPDSEPEFWEGKARLVVISGLGEIAHKESKKWIIPDPQFDAIVIKYPEFRRGFFKLITAQVLVEGEAHRACKVHDLSTLAINELNSKNSQVKGRAIGKAIAKYAAKKVTKAVAQMSKNTAVKAASLIANLALNVQDVVEEADTRSWMTMPDHYRMAIIPVTPGTHTVKVVFSGGTSDSQSFDMAFTAGETRFLVTRGREGFLSNSPAKPVEPERESAVAPLSLLLTANEIHGPGGGATVFARNGQWPCLLMRKRHCHRPDRPKTVAPSFDGE